jgi:hypothetical protein
MADQQIQTGQGYGLFTGIYTGISYVNWAREAAVNSVTGHITAALKAINNSAIQPVVQPIEQVLEVVNNSTIKPVVKPIGEVLGVVNDYTIKPAGEGLHFMTIKPASYVLGVANHNVLKPVGNILHYVTVRPFNYSLDVFNSSVLKIEEVTLPILDKMDPALTAVAGVAGLAGVVLVIKGILDQPKSQNPEDIAESDERAGKMIKLGAFFVSLALLKAAPYMMAYSSQEEACLPEEELMYEQCLVE